MTYNAQFLVCLFNGAFWGRFGTVLFLIFQSICFDTLSPYAFLSLSVPEVRRSLPVVAVVVVGSGDRFITGTRR
jgi:hypothetical protein